MRSRVWRWMNFFSCRSMLTAVPWLESWARVLASCFSAIPVRMKPSACLTPRVDCSQITSSTKAAGSPPAKGFYVKWLDLKGQARRRLSRER